MTTRQVAVKVVVFQDQDWVCAQCLDYDIAARAQNLDDCLYEFQRLMMGRIAIAMENGVEPFEGLPKAPRRFWEWFERSRIALPRVPEAFAATAEAFGRAGVVVQPPQVRVAQLQAA
ncbi:MAG TPA: hypothetical protein VFV05_09360 [Methylomirabilota bacterium]|nr:hypothetical protein [Methylomirabilota bacterium]